MSSLLNGLLTGPFIQCNTKGLELEPLNTYGMCTELDNKVRPIGRMFITCGGKCC